MMQCNWYKHAMRRETRRGHWLHVPARARHVSLPRCGGHITISKKSKAYTFSNHPLRPEASPEPTEFGPRPLSTKTRSCILSADCMREVPLPRMSLPLKATFCALVRFERGKKKDRNVPAAHPSSPRP